MPNQRVQIPPMSSLVFLRSRGHTAPVRSASFFFLRRRSLLSPSSQVAKRANTKPTNRTGQGDKEFYDHGTNKRPRKHRQELARRNGPQSNENDGPNYKTNTRRVRQTMHPALADVQRAVTDGQSTPTHFTPVTESPLPRPFHHATSAAMVTVTALTLRLDTVHHAVDVNLEFGAVRVVAVEEA